jgi:phenylalanyl-tRNA synthetase beta chain
VARTARRHRLPSEAAKRFERGVDPEMTVVALARPPSCSPSTAARASSGTGRRRHPPPRPDRSRWTRPARPGRRRALPAAQVVELLDAVGCTVDGDGEPLDGHPAVLAARPHRPGRPGRGGRPAGRLRRRPLGAADRAARARAHRRQRRRRSVGRALAEAGYVEAPSYPFVGTAALDALGLPEDDPRRRPCGAQPAVGGGAGAAHDAAARPARHAGPQPRPRAARRRAVRARRGLPRRVRTPAPVPGVDRRPDDETLAALLGAVPEQPWHVAVALAGNREPRGWWGPGRPAVWADAVEAARLVAAAAGRRADRAGGGAGAVAPRPLRRAAGRRPGRRARRRAAPAGVRGAGAAARTSVMELDVDALPAGPGAGRPARSRPSRRCSSTSRWSSRRRPGRRGGGRAARGRRRAAGGPAAVRRLHRPQVPAGQKSLAYALTLRAPDRTLTSEEATAVRDAAPWPQRRSAWAEPGRGRAPWLTSRAGRAGHRRLDRHRPAPRRGAGRPRHGRGRAGPRRGPAADGDGRGRRGHRRPHARRGRRRHRPRRGRGRRRRVSASSAGRPAGQQRRADRRRRGAALGGRPRPVVGRGHQPRPRRASCSAAPSSPGWCCATAAGSSTWPAA